MVRAVAERMSMLRRIEVRVLEEPVRLLRIVTEPASQAFEDAFRSHYELGRPPRGPEIRAAAIHVAISMFDTTDVARALAARVPKLGGHIATVDLQPEFGICVAKTGGPAHWSVWGQPGRLASFVIDVEQVAR
jgi:hypothetical protein